MKISWFTENFQFTENGRMNVIRKQNKTKQYKNGKMARNSTSILEK